MQELKVHVPARYHERIRDAITTDRPMGVRLDLQTAGEDSILATPGKILKINRAINSGKKVLTIRMSRKQVRRNLEHKGGFLGALLGFATRMLPKILPALLGGLATGVLSGVVEKAIAGNGLFMGKRGYGTVKIDFTEGGGLILTHVQHDKRYNGLYVRHEGQIFHGKGILFGPNSPFKNIPILGIFL